MKAPKYWPKWGVTIVREEAAKFHREMAGEWPNPEYLVEKYTRAVEDEIDRSFRGRTATGEVSHTASKTFVSRFENSKLGPDIEKMLMHFHRAASKAIRSNPRKKTHAQKAIKSLSMPCFIALEDLEREGIVNEVYELKAGYGGSLRVPTLVIDVSKHDERVEAIRDACDRPDRPMIVTEKGILYTIQKQYRDKKTFRRIDFAARRGGKTFTAPAIEVSFMPRGHSGWHRGGAWYFEVMEGTAIADANTSKRLDDWMAWRVDSPHPGLGLQKFGGSYVSGHYVDDRVEMVERHGRTFRGHYKQDAYPLTEKDQQALLSWVPVAARALEVEAARSNPSGGSLVDWFMR